MTDKILNEADVKFGSSMEFIASLISSNNIDTFEMKKLSKAVKEEAETLASCDYEKDTQWGKEVSTINMLFFEWQVNFDWDHTLILSHTCLH